MCSLGCTKEESQEHLLECDYIIDNLEDKYILAESDYTDLFGNVPEQLNLVKCFREIFKIRDKLLES